MKILFFVFALLVSTSSNAVQCYKWKNNTNQMVSLTIHYLNGSFNPTGQTASYLIKPHESYPISDVNCWGLNSYGLAKVKNGNASWDMENTIFGTAPGGTYQIN